MYKAIIESIESNGYQAKIRIPFFDKIAGTLGSTPNYSLYVADICSQPGINPVYNVGDIVFIDFENNDNSLPVILGILYREDSKSSCNIETESLKVEVFSSLPENTSIGEVRSDNIKSLIGITEIS